MTLHSRLEIDEHMLSVVKVLKLKECGISQ